MAQGAQGVVGLPRLADSAKAVLGPDLRDVGELVRADDGQKPPPQAAEEILPHRRDVIGRSHAAQEALPRFVDHSSQRLNVFSGYLESGLDGGGLIVNLLEHKMGIAAPAGLFGVPLDLGDFLVDALSREQAPDRIALRRDERVFAVFHDDRPAGVLEERAEIGTHVVRVVPEADDEGRFALHAENPARRVDRDDRQSEGAFEFVDRLDEALLHVLSVSRDFLRHQVRDDLRIRIGSERGTFAREPLFKFLVVRDDAVVDHGQTALVVRVGVRVRLRHPAVRRPARMRDAHQPLHVREALERIHRLHGAHVLSDVNHAVSLNRHAAGVVAPIFQGGDGAQEFLRDVRARRHARNAAHASSLPAGRCSDAG